MDVPLTRTRPTGRRDLPVGYVIADEVHGVFLGQSALGEVELWSRGETYGHNAAVTFLDADRAASMFHHVAFSGKSPRVVEVRIAEADGVATMADCVRAGLPAWTVDGRACRYELRSWSGRFLTGVGTSLGAAYTEVVRSEALLNPRQRVPSLNHFDILDCKPLGDDEVARRIAVQSRLDARQAEQEALQAHNQAVIASICGHHFTHESDDVESEELPQAAPAP